MRVLLAFNPFKDALDATAACAAARAALRDQHPDWNVISTPLTDGGEGFTDILTAAAGGAIEQLEVEGPRGQSVRARIGWVDAHAISSVAHTLACLPNPGRIAIVEMAQASGLEQVPLAERDPWLASTFGTGQLLRHAIDQKASAIILGIGGSATNDAGTGALAAMGLRFLDADGKALHPVCPRDWSRVHRLEGPDTRWLQRLPPLRIACDVNNPLLGAHGATAVFGPQKGLRPDDFTALEAAVRGIAIRVLEHMGLREESAVVHLDEPGGGAAGGIGFGLRALFRDSRFVNGFGLVRGWLQLDRSIVDADWIVTGEGALDASSLRGKGAVALLRLAGPAKHVTILAGKVDHAVAADLKAAYPRVEIVQLAPDGWPLEQALAATADNIRAQVLACASSQQA